MGAERRLRITTHAPLTSLLIAVLLSCGAAACHRDSHSAHATATKGTTYYCPMHPSYKSEKPGECPICSMKLVPLESAPSASPSDTADHRPPADTRIRISPERQQQIGVQLAEAKVGAAHVEIHAVGRIAYDETRIAHVHTKVGGWIDEVFVSFVGAPVRRGQPLFTLYSPDLVASQEEYLQARKAAEDLGSSTLPRVASGAKALLAAAKTRLELWDMTAADIGALERTGEVSRTVTVHSPVDGVVTERAAYHHGRTVTPELDLYTIVDLSQVWVLAQVFEYEVPYVAVGQAVEARLAYDSTHPPLRGAVAFVAPVVDPKTRTVEVRMDLANPDSALKPESFVNVALTKDLGAQLIVPKDAVMNTGEKQYVFVDQGDGYLEPREVKAGPEVAEGIVVGSGLAAGERVVTAANFVLDSESRLKGAFAAMGKPVSTRQP